MRDERRDVAHLWDMLEAAKAILEFTPGTTLEEYRADLKLRSAVERQVEIIGEAARRVSEPFRLAHPDIPWRQMIGQRNVLIHEYDEIDDERIWRLAVEAVPRLVEQLTPLIPPPPEDVST